MSNSIQKAAAKIAGKTARVEARFKGLTGVLAKLVEQHHEVSTLLSIASGTDDLATRSELWRQIREALLSHEQAELLALYPVLETYLSTREIAHRHALQASELEDLVFQMDDIEVRSDRWRPALERLIVQVKEHIAKEEGEFFPRAQEALGEYRTNKLEATYLRAQEVAKQRLA